MSIITAPPRYDFRNYVRARRYRLHEVLTAAVKEQCGIESRVSVYDSEPRIVCVNDRDPDRYDGKFYGMYSYPELVESHLIDDTPPVRAELRQLILRCGQIDLQAADGTTTEEACGILTLTVAQAMAGDGNIFMSKFHSYDFELSAEDVLVWPQRPEVGALYAKCKQFISRMFTNITACIPLPIASNYEYRHRFFTLIGDVAVSPLLRDVVVRYFQYFTADRTGSANIRFQPYTGHGRRQFPLAKFTIANPLVRFRDGIIPLGELVFYTEEYKRMYGNPTFGQSTKGTPINNILPDPQFPVAQLFANNRFYSVRRGVSWIPEYGFDAPESDLRRACRIIVRERTENHDGSWHEFAPNAYEMPCFMEYLTSPKAHQYQTDTSGLYTFLTGKGDLDLTGPMRRFYLCVNERYDDCQSLLRHFVSPHEGSDLAPNLYQSLLDHVSQLDYRRSWVIGSGKRTDLDQTHHKANVRVEVYFGGVRIHQSDESDNLDQATANEDGENLFIGRILTALLSGNHTAQSIIGICEIHIIYSRSRRPSLDGADVVVNPNAPNGNPGAGGAYQPPQLDGGDDMQVADMCC